MLESIERALFWWNSLMESDIDSYCQLQTPLDDHTWMMTNGDLASVIAILGSKMLVGDTEFAMLTDRLAKKLGVLMRAGGGIQHSFAIGARDDPAAGLDLVRSLYAPMIESMRRIGIPDTSIVDDRALAIGQHCTDASVYLIVYTHRAALTPHEREREKERRTKDFNAYAQAKGPRVTGVFAQLPFVQSAQIVPRHKAAVESLVKDLEESTSRGGIALLCDLLTAEQGAVAIDQHLHAAPRKAWTPRLFGGARPQLAVDSARKGDASQVLPMRVSRQMIDAKAQEIFGDVEMVKREGVYYASVVVEQGPSNEVRSFQRLRESIASGIDRKRPWVASFEITPDGLSRNKTEQTFAAFLGGFGDHNKRIKRAYDLLRAMSQQEPVVALRIVFTTWGRTETECVDNLSFIKGQIQNWGSIIASNDTGSPALAQVASAAGYAYRSPAPYIAEPLLEACKMLPMFDSASIYRHGQIVLRTTNGRPYPLHFGSTLQNFWGTGIFAPTGSGKSFFLLMLNLGFALAAGSNRLNRIVNIDVGPSFRLLVDLLRAILPPEQHHQALYLRISNSREYAVNPWDTHLGLDQPTNLDEGFLQSVLGTVSPLVAEHHPQFIGMVIRASYKLYARDSKDAKHWQPAFDEALHAKAIALGIPFDEGRTRVWDIVDGFMERGHVVEASSAQRYAVPILQDMIRAARSKEIMDLYERAMVGSERLLDVFVRDVTTGVDNYRLIAGVTQYDVGSARVLGIDLAEVLGNVDTSEGQRLSQMMYLFARRLGARKFFIRWEGEIEKLCPPLYAEHHRRECASMREAPKLLEYDEIHNARSQATNDDGTPKISPMLYLIMKDLREGRKYLTITMMSSQLLDDFPREAIDNMYNFFVMGLGSDTSTKKVQETFGLSDTEIQAIEDGCTGPGTLFGFFRTRRGRLSQVLKSDAGPLERWAFNTDSEDVLVRDAVAERVAYMDALKLLAKRFPSGTARDFLDKLRQGARGRVVEGQFVARVVDHVLLESP